MHTSIKGNPKEYCELIYHLCLRRYHINGFEFHLPSVQCEKWQRSYTTDLICRVLNWLLREILWRWFCAWTHFDYILGFPYSCSLLTEPGQGYILKFSSWNKVDLLCHWILKNLVQLISMLFTFNSSTSHSPNFSNAFYGPSYLKKST